MRSFIRRKPFKKVPSDLLGAVEFGARLTKTLLELDQLCTEVLPLCSVTPGRRTDVGAAGRPNLNESLGCKQLNRRRCRVHRDPVLCRQLAIGGQPLADRIPPGFLDLRPQQGCEAPTR